MISFVQEHITALPSKKKDFVQTKKAIRLDLSESPYPPSPKVIKAISETAPTINRYPEKLGGYLRNALVDYTGAREGQIIIGNGSDDLIDLILKVFVSSQEQILVPIPTFPWYWFSAKAQDKEVLFANRTEDFGLNVDTVVEKVTSKVKVIFIANPNNPTGNLIPRSTLVELIERVNCLIVVDECYFEISQETVADLIDTYSNLIVLRSFSKGFALAGLRIGYAIANEVLIDYLYRTAQFFCVNSLAQVAGIAALSDLVYLRSQIQNVERERTRLIESFSKLGFTVYPSATNFIFIGTKLLDIASSDLVKRLQNKDIYVKDCGLSPGLDGFYFRTSISNYTDNQALLNAVNEIISFTTVS